MRRPLVRNATAAAMAFLLAACGDDANVIGPDNQPEVANTTDTFEWQVSNLSNVSQALGYSWTNTGTTADVNQSSALEGGTAMLRVTDGQGVEVYLRSLSENGTFRTDAGSAGDWTVTVTLSEASGSANFRLENPDAAP